MTDPQRGRSWPPSPGPPAPHPSRSSRWLALGLGLALLGLAAVAVATYVLGDGGEPARPQPRAVPSGTVVPSSELDGAWSGEGSLIRCAGFDDEDCPATFPVTLTVDCAQDPCAVTPFDGSYGRPPLRFEDGRYRAAGPVPPDAAPTCGGAPTRSALWRLEFAVVDGRLVGSYEESTIQGFDCGATGVAWAVVLERV